MVGLSKSVCCVRGTGADSSRATLQLRLLLQARATTCSFAGQLPLARYPSYLPLSVRSLRNSLVGALIAQPLIPGHLQHPTCIAFVGGLGYLTRVLVPSVVPCSGFVLSMPATSSRLHIAHAQICNARQLHVHEANTQGQPARHTQSP